MSAAATAAGYLYASGRLRSKSKDGDPESPRTGRAERREEMHEARAPRRRPLRIAAIRDVEPSEAPQPVARPRPAVKVEYRTRKHGRWVWQRVTSRHLTATASGRSLIIRGTGGRSLKRGPYRVTASIAGAAKVHSFKV